MNLAMMLGQATEDLSGRLDQPPPDELEALLQLLDEIAVVHRAVLDAQRVIARHASDLVMLALRQGAEPRDLYNRPYNGRMVLELYKRTGLPPRRPGPPPARMT